MLAAFLFEWIKHENDENENDWRVSTKRLVSQNTITRGRTWSKGVGYIEPKNTADKRVMDISAFIHKGDNGCEVVRCVTSCSDGEIAIIELDEVSRKFEKVFATCLNDKPVLSVSTVTVANELSSRTFLATGSTDGTVAIWNVNIVSAPLLVLKEAHQSGEQYFFERYDQDQNAHLLPVGTIRKLRFRSLLLLHGAVETSRSHARARICHPRAMSDGANIVSTVSTNAYTLGRPF